MTSQCFSLVRGRMMRATRLTGCGQIDLGPRSQVTTKGFISVALTPNTEEGEAISVTNASGEVCVLDEPAPRFQNYGVTITFCKVDPELVSMLTGQPTVLDADGTLAVGFRVNSGVSLIDSGFALELWSTVPSAACDSSGSSSYGYMLIPFLQGGVLGDFTVENAAVTFTLTGAVSKDGSEWGVGPYDVVRDNGGLPSPLLTPIDAKDHLHLQVTTVAPPTEECGATEVGTLATGATAGTPGDWTPANSYGPEDLVALQASGITASPATAWTTGQYVVLEDGSSAHWDGSAWVAGVAS